MKLYISLLALLAGTLTLSAQDITGTWVGNLDLGAANIRIAFHVEREGDGYSATMDSPDQGANGIPVTSIDFVRDTLRMSIKELAFIYTGVLKGNAFEGSFTQRGVPFPLNLERGEIAMNRPQEPKPPFPYNSEDVCFDNKEAGITLAGTLTWPAEGKKFPAVVMLTGSGTQNRDEELYGHKPFLVIADWFARNGIATLRFDDRGFSNPEEADGVTTADFATDAFAAVEYLKTRKEINRKKIGLAGHSEGGFIAFIAASEHPDDIAFVVSMAGPGVRGDSLLLTQTADILRFNGRPEPLVQFQVSSQRRISNTINAHSPEFVTEKIDSLCRRLITGYGYLEGDDKTMVQNQVLATNSPWYRFFRTQDPADYIRKVKCPVLAINGENDLQVRSQDNLNAIQNALTEGGNMNFEIIEYPGLNHLFQHIVTGSLEEYNQLEETISPEVLEDMTAWILKNTK